MNVFISFYICYYMMQRFVGNIYIEQCEIRLWELSLLIFLFKASGKKKKRSVIKQYDWIWQNQVYATFMCTKQLSNIWLYNFIVLFWIKSSQQALE